MKDKVIIRNTDGRGLGLFANFDFKKGQLVVHGRGLYKTKQRTNHSFQMDEFTHMQLDKVSRSINHSCEPNTGVRNNQCRAYDFIALRNIKKGEEITWDYETTEYISIAVRKCLCGTVICRGQTKGYKFLDNETKKRYGQFIADYLKKKEYSKVIGHVDIKSAQEMI
jgi:uncharacterized protein